MNAHARLGVLAAVAATASVVAQPAKPQSLSLTAPTHHLFADRMAREPMVVEHPGGALFVAGYGTPSGATGLQPNLWKSVDRGKSWRIVDVGSPAQGVVGNSDVDLAMAADGTLYFVSMSFDRKASQGTDINIGVSYDVGATWTWTRLSDTRWDDRPWVEVAPNGTAHVIWNDGEGVSHAVSTDRGKWWTELPRIHPQGGSSHLAIGPKGEVAVRLTPHSASGFKDHPEVDLIAVSLDEGKTWQKHRAPGQRTWTPMMELKGGGLPRWVEPITWDAAGTLYSLWTDHSGVHLARSGDRGSTWQQSLIVESKEATAFFPYLVARGAGELAATWFSAKLPDYAMLRAHVARITSRGDGAPEVRVAPPVSFEALDARGNPQTGGEYLPVAFLRDGTLAVVTPIQNLKAKRLGFSWWVAR